MSRRDVISFYRNNPKVSVLIVGGGINGIGTLRDLALQGVDALLVDKVDFCSGASAASTRLAHGGIRYLEHGAFGLVRESLTERNRLRQNAPHAVHPIPFGVPIYGWLAGILNAPLTFLGLLKRPSERGWLVLWIGIAMYDGFTRNNRATPSGRMLSRADALKQHKKLNPRIIGMATYYDMLMPYAERIGLEIVLDTEADHEHAHALNYVSAVSAEGDAVTLRDEMTGETFDVRPTIVINAGGAWIDLVNNAFQRDTKFIGGTKGSHIIVDHPAMWETLNGSALYFGHKDGRMCIFMPLGDKVVIGATDIRIDDPDSAVCSDDEIDYFLDFTSQVMPEISFDRSHIVYHFSGVRPLPYSDVEFTGLVTREHSIKLVEKDGELSFPIYSLIGGKWTTYRSFAEQATDTILARLGRNRVAGTANLAIGGGKHYPHANADRETWLAQVEGETGLSKERLETLFGRYGTRGDEVARFIAAGEDQPLGTASGYSQREMMFVASQEKVLHLDDIVLRRSLLAMQGQVTYDVLVQLGNAVGSVLGWSEAQLQDEIERVTNILANWHGVSLSRLRPVSAPA